MRAILSLFLVLLFVASCGGGGDGSNGGDDELPPFEPFTPTAGTGGNNEVCQRQASLPRGVIPIEGSLTYELSGDEITLYDDGTYCFSSSGIRHCDDWIWAQNRCLCVAVETIVLCSASSGSCQSCYDSSSGFHENDEVLRGLFDAAPEVLTELE